MIIYDNHLYTLYLHIKFILNHISSLTKLSLLLVLFSNSTTKSSTTPYLLDLIFLFQMIPVS